MCGRYVHRFTWRDLYDLLSLAPFTTGPVIPGPSFNVAPTHMVPVLQRSAGAQIEGALARWGFIPRWWRKQSPPSHTINARSEGAAASRIFAEALQSGRCIVPASGFFEWQGHKPPRTPLYITRADGKPLLFAGLLSGHNGVLTTAILTTSASPEIAAIHDRMPVVLEPEEVAQWLDPAAQPERIQALMDPAAAGTLVFHPVSTRVNSPGTNDPDLIVPVREHTPLTTGEPPRRSKRPPEHGLFDAAAPE